MSCSIGAIRFGPTNPHHHTKHLVPAQELLGFGKVSDPKEVMALNTWKVAVSYPYEARAIIADARESVTQGAQAPVVPFELADGHLNSIRRAAIFVGCTVPLGCDRNVQMQWIIFTKHGWLPNDIDAMYSYWNGVDCPGMHESMTMADFQTWWAEQIAKGFYKYMEKRAH